MKVADIITRVRNIAGDVNVLQFTNEQVLDWVNDGVRECAIQNNLLQKRGTQTVVSGQREYSLPADVMRLHSVRYDNDKLSIRTMEEFDEVYGDSTTATGTPTVCYVWAGFLNLYPTPDNSVKQLVIDYIYDPAPILIADIATTEPPLPTSYHARLVDYCLAQVAQQDDDYNRYQLKMQEFKSGVQDLKDLPEWEYDQYPYISVDIRDMGDGW